MYITISVSGPSADEVCPLLDDRAFWRDVTQLGDVILGLDEHDG